MDRVKLQTIRLFSYGAILTERLSVASWRAITWVLFFAGLWLFQIPNAFGQYMSMAVTAIFLTGLFYFLYKGFKNFHLPSTRELERRIETDSKIRHRPLSNAKDKLISEPTDFAQTLWTKNKLFLQRALERLRPAKIQTQIANKDPHALRYAALFFCICGLLIAGPESGARLTHGLIPFSIPESEKPVPLQLIITPPTYVGKIDDAAIKTNDGLKIPLGSTVKIIINNGSFAPRLYIDDQAFPFITADDKTFIAETTITKGSKLSIRRFFLTFASWNYEIIPDLPPAITVKSEPLITNDSQLIIPLEVNDDYGVENLKLELTLDPKAGKLPLGERITETRSILSPAKTAYTISPVYDFSGHPWAGQAVQIKLTASDHLDQTATAEPVSIILPERNFRHPVAQKLIEIRKYIINHPETETQSFASTVESFLNIPSLYQDDIVTFLAIRSLASRFYYSKPSIENARDLVPFIWDLAIKIEDGDLPLAERNLRRVQNALDRALQNDASDNEIAALMHELREAMAAYLTEMQRELQKQMADPNNKGKQLLSLDPDAVQNFLDEMMDAIKEGNREAAQNMLSQLQRMMDMVTPKTAEMPKDMLQMQQIINELQQLIDRQEKLLRTTNMQMQKLGILSLDGTQPIDPAILLQLGQQDMQLVHTKNEADEQEILRHMLGQTMLGIEQVFKKIPDNLQSAEKEMRGSYTALDKNDPQTSIPHQEETLRLLKQSQDESIQQFMMRLAQIGGTMPNGGQGMQYDPLGRPYGAKEGDGGLFPGSQVKIPNEAERQQALEILRELRRRSGQRERPPLELDYYRRLLKQF